MSPRTAQVVTLVMMSIALFVSTPKEGGAGDPLTAAGGKYVASVDDSGDSLATLPDSQPNIDLTAGTTYFYDTNTTQFPNGPEASVFAFDFGAEITSGSESARGGYYGLDYEGRAFAYESAAARAGRDSLEHSVGAFLGLNGGKTRFRMSTNYHRNNGNSISFGRFFRETRRAPSHDFDVNLSLVRTLPHGSLEFGAGSSRRDFDAGTGLNDASAYYGDVAWFYAPGFAPKTNLGVGFRFGSDDYRTNFDQDFYEPSARWRYRYSSKTSFYASAGQEFRSVDGMGARETDNFVYRGGVTWVATKKTTFDLGFHRDVRPSYVSAFEDYTRTGVSLEAESRLPREFVLSTDVAYENADYFATAGGGNSIREDDYLRLGVDVAHPVRLGHGLDGEVGVFYHYNENDSTVGLAGFEQHVTGVRFGVTY